MPSISVTILFNFNRMKVTFSEVAERNNFNFAGVVLMPDKRYSPICSSCGQKSSAIHQIRSRIVRDIPLGNFRKPYISYYYRLVKCSYCQGIYTEATSVTGVGGPKVTYRLATLVKDLCKIMTLKEVADNIDLDGKTVKEVDKEALQQEYSKTDYSYLRFLAVDEIAYSKHHKYLTIVINYETGRVVWIGEGRSKETLRESLMKSLKP